MPKQSEIDRMLVLLYRSNNAHDFVNFVRPANWLDALPKAGLQELSDMLGIIRRDVDEVLAQRKS